MGTTAQKLEYLGITKSQLKDMINYGLDDNNKITSSTTFRNYVSSVKEAFLEALRNPDTLFTNLPKKTGTGANITLNDTANAPMRITLSPSELTQAGTPTPSSPQDIHTISGSNKVVVSNSDNSVSQEQEVDLGDIEYCKIGNYEDKFIKIKSDIKLPSAYTQVEYIEATGTQYIDTGYTPVQNDEFEVKNINITSSNGGAIISAGTGSYQLILLKQAQHTYYRYFSSGGAEDIVVSEYTGNTITINKNGELYLDGTLKSTKAYGGAVDTTLQLFRRANASSYLTGSIGEVKITNNGTTKKHLISCKRNSDNVIGMYDLVNNQFYTNAGTGTFTAGIELNKWYIKKNIGKVVLDGTENWGTNASWNYTNTNCYVYTWNLAPTTMLSNYYKYNSSAYNNDISGQMGIVWGGTLLLRIDKTLASDVADFKTWLSTHNTTIMYPLSTPTYTKITGTLASQLENVYQKLLSYEGQTNISQVNNDLSFVLNVQAIEG